MNTERLIHMPQCSTIDLSAICNSSNSIWKTIESHRWVKLSCENIGMCLSYAPITLVIRLINSWDFIQVRYDNKMLSSQWDNDNQHFVYIIISWYLLGIITRQGFLFSSSCMNRCTCFVLKHERRGINLLKNIVAMSAMKNRLLWCLIQFLYRDHPWIHIPYWTNTLHLPCCGKNRPLHK